jgi:hypothetical protein
MPDQAPAQPRTREGQPAPVRPHKGQEATGGSTGQGTTGRKVAGQETTVRPVAGQSTAPRSPSRPNR